MLGNRQNEFGMTGFPQAMDFALGQDAFRFFDRELLGIGHDDMHRIRQHAASIRIQ